MSKFRKDFRIGVLGGVAGVFSVSVFLLVARIDSYYSYLTVMENIGYAEPRGHVEDLWWVALLLGQVSLSVLTSLVVHRYLGGRGESPFLIWQAIGFGSLLAWGLSIFVVVGVNCLMRGNFESVMSALRPINFGLAKYVSAIVASHVMFGSFVQAAVRQYGEQPQVSAEVGG